MDAGPVRPKRHRLRPCRGVTEHDNGNDKCGSKCHVSGSCCRSSSSRLVRSGSGSWVRVPAAGCCRGRPRPSPGRQGPLRSLSLVVADAHAHDENHAGRDPSRGADERSPWRSKGGETGRPHVVSQLPEQQRVQEVVARLAVVQRRPQRVSVYRFAVEQRVDLAVPSRYPEVSGPCSSSVIKPHKRRAAVVQ